MMVMILMLMMRMVIMKREAACGRSGASGLSVQ